MIYIYDFTSQEKEEWSKICARQLLEKFPENTIYHFYVGKFYLQGILPILTEAGRKYECYLNDMTIGYKQQWFTKHIRKSKRRLF